MERLQAGVPINPCLFGDEGHHRDLDVECYLEQEPPKKLGGFSSVCSYEQFVSSDHSLMSFKEEEDKDDDDGDGLEPPHSRRMPFLETLQSGGESPAFSPAFSCELGFQALLSLQQFNTEPPYHQQYSPPPPPPPPPLQPIENREMKKRKRMKRTSSTTTTRTTTRPSAKNKEEAESQRMTHIAVERNRRRQMNDHLSSLRSFMPPSYAQRGDQASIIGGAIDFVKELEQLLQSLEAQKRMRKSEFLLDQLGGGETTTSSSTSSTTAAGIFAAPSPTSTEYRNIKSEGEGEAEAELGNCNTEKATENYRRRRRSNEFTAEMKSGAVGVQVTVIQNHVNLKVECPRMAGQLLTAIVAFEELGLTVLHLTITSLETSVHYSFNLKIEEGCEVGSADGIAVAVHQIFSFINGTSCC